MSSLGGPLGHDGRFILPTGAVLLLVVREWSRSGSARVVDVVGFEAAGVATVAPFGELVAGLVGARWLGHGFRVNGGGHRPAAELVSDAVSSSLYGRLRAVGARTL